MVFNSPDYFFFFGLFWGVFALVNRPQTLALRNGWLLAGSYWFYAQFHVWFVGLLIYMTLVNYGCGRWIMHQKRQGRRGKGAVATAILLSLLVLVLFKYAYLADASVLLPVGLSFFTFQALTYTIDIYRGKMEAAGNPFLVALFVAFFPTLLSGPIERARNLLPQLRQVSSVTWDGVCEGAGLFVWGLFKKVVIADRLADYVNMAYWHPETQTGSTLALAAVCYSFQIYCDFSGYADMAVGSGRMLGFRISPNFNFPYCVNTLKEFWRRWHISLTSWFTEYVYISMGGNRVGRLRWIVNISVVFLLSGIWHGATWSFVVWGGIHALLYLIEYYVGPKKPGLPYHVLIFLSVTLAWIFFRIESFSTACTVIDRICSGWREPLQWGSSQFSTLLTLALGVLFVIREYLLYKQLLPRKYMIEYVLLILGICLFGMSSDQFVYFQF